MEERINKLRKEVQQFSGTGSEALEIFRLKFMSKKGAISELFDELKKVPAEEKKKVGKILNELKQAAEAKLAAMGTALQSSKQTQNIPDLTLPPIPNKAGNLHPLTLIRNRIIEIFERLGFNVADGPEIEDDWHNFTALNFPENHPAREMQDTFFYTEKSGFVIAHTYVKRADTIDD
ncbi:hypothetical protein QQ054_05810 [Oscillatoria amoena NRMC-F 0135]|nr:hypothetical protein [Oscillatoria amoena NRMC-F 0135]